MSENERPRTPDETPIPEGLGNPFSMGGETGGAVAVDYGVYREQLPLGGSTIGDIRRIAGPRFDISPDATAFIDGNPVADDVVVSAGQNVRFMHISGEKGQDLFDQLLHEAAEIFAPTVKSSPRPRRASPKITIEGCTAGMTTPEGVTVTLDLESLLNRLSSQGPVAEQVRDLVWPDGVKAVVSYGKHVMLVHQTPPSIHSLRWIDKSSEIRHGPGTKYRQVRIALPYLIVLAGFVLAGHGQLRIGDRNECFFRTEPLRSLSDPLFYPALLNCSKFKDPQAKPLSWICTQFLERTALPRDAGISEQIRTGLTDLMHCMVESGFNESSEEHELSSWFTESKAIDPRLSTIERWEEATRKDPMFVLDVPWIPVDKSVGEVVNRSLKNQTIVPVTPPNARTMARLITRYGKAVPADSKEMDA